LKFFLASIISKINPFWGDLKFFANFIFLNQKKS
jgi:hypothetical protein